MIDFQGIKQLHNNIIGCFTQLDKKIYKAMNVQPISQTVIIERENISIAQDLQKLQIHVQELQQKYDELCSRYIQLNEIYHQTKLNLKMKSEELIYQVEYMKVYKMKQLQQPELVQIPVFQYIKEFTKHNHSQFSIFLNTLLYMKKQDLQMIELLQYIEKHYKPQTQIRFQEKFICPKIPLRKIQDKILNTYSENSISQLPERSISFN